MTESDAFLFLLIARSKCAALALDSASGYIYYVGVSMSYTKRSYIAVLKPMSEKHYTLISNRNEITSFVLYEEKGYVSFAYIVGSFHFSEMQL